jgi:hypothetical protein
MRMLSTEGNPRADNLFAVVGHLRKQEGMTFMLRPDGQSASHLGQ